MNETASRTWSGVSIRGTISPCAPRSRARPIRSRSPDWGRTRAAVGVRAHRVEVGEQLRLGPDAVLEVDDQPVEPGPRQELRGERRAERGERAVEGLAGLEPTAKVDEAGDWGEVVSVIAQ